MFCLPLRQRKLEEALLHSGQFKDALQALLEWLYQVEPTLSDETPVDGDIDTVMNLMDSSQGKTSANHSLFFSFLYVSHSNSIPLRLDRCA